MNKSTGGLMTTGILKEKISKYKNRFIPSSKNMQKEFYTTIAKENFIRLLCLSIFYFLFELRIRLNLPPPKSEMLGIISTFIFYFQAFTILISIWQIRKKKPLNGIFAHWFISIYCILVLTWSVSVSLNQVLTTGSITMFILTLTATSAIFYRRILITLVTNFSFYIYFAYNMKYVLDAPVIRPGPQKLPRMIELYIADAFLITAISCIIGIIVFRLRLSVFYEKKTLEELISKDAMTGVLNHHAICEVLKTETLRAKRYDLPMSVLIIDIDHFKTINDTHGHQFGDKVIVEVAKMMQLNCRETDFIGRYGGDEFLLVLTNTTNDKAYEICDRLRKSIEKITFDNSCTVTVSCGLKNHHDETDDELIKHADEALYQAKKNGRNRIFNL